MGDYELSVAVHAYQNPSHRAANGFCCDLFCSLSCDNYFVFCLRALEEEEGCGLGELHTGEVGGGDNLTLSPGDGSSMGRQPNPMTVSSSGAWMVRVNGAESSGSGAGYLEFCNLSPLRVLPS